jgi:hypothetical protein
MGSLLRPPVCESCTSGRRRGLKASGPVRPSRLRDAATRDLAFPLYCTGIGSTWKLAATSQHLLWNPYALCSAGLQAARVHRASFHSAGNFEPRAAAAQGRAAASESQRRLLRATCCRVTGLAGIRTRAASSSAPCRGCRCAFGREELVPRGDRNLPFGLAAAQL